MGDVAYACAMGLSELLRRDAPDLARRGGRLPRVMVSALPILDPLVPGRMENLPNSLAYIPQMGTTFSNRMVRAHCACVPFPPSDDLPNNLAYVPQIGTAFSNRMECAHAGGAPCMGAAPLTTNTSAWLAGHQVLCVCAWPGGAAAPLEGPALCPGHRYFLSMIMIIIDEHFHLDVCHLCAQTFWQRAANLAFYWGSLAGEQLRALPLYARLCTAHGIDCLSAPVAHGATMFLYNMVRPQGFRV